MERLQKFDLNVTHLAMHCQIILLMMHCQIILLIKDPRLLRIFLVITNTQTKPEMIFPA